MLIFHENMPLEATETEKTLLYRLGIPSRLINGNLGPIVKYTPNNGIYMFKQKKMEKILPEIRRIPTLIYTNRDIYDTDVAFDAENTWLYGFDEVGPNQNVVSVASLKGHNSDKVQERRSVTKNRYLKRVITSGFHELGHKIVKGNGKHFEEAFYVNEKEGIKEPLNPHCPDLKCIMYEAIDMHAPKNGYEYLLIGNEKRFDAGNEEQLDRMYPEWFCKDCRDSIVIEEKYFFV